MEGQMRGVYILIDNERSLVWPVADYVDTSDKHPGWGGKALAGFFRLKSACWWLKWRIE